MYDLERINNAAAEMDNFGGQEDYDGYDGYEDDHLNFAGDAQSFAQELNTDRTFTFNISNPSTTDAKMVTIFPSVKGTNTGSILVDGANTDGVVSSTTDSDASIKFLHNHITFHPTNIVGMKVNTNNTAQLQQVISVQQVSPWEKFAEKRIPLSLFSSEKNSNDKMLTVPVNFQVANDVQVTMMLLPSTQINLIFIAGAIYSTSDALRRKTKRAGRNPQVAAVRGMAAQIGR